MFSPVSMLNELCDKLAVSVMLFTYQDAVNDVIAAGLNVFYSALMKFIPDKVTCMQHIQLLACRGWQY